MTLNSSPRRCVRIKEKTKQNAVKCYETRVGLIKDTMPDFDRTGGISGAKPRRRKWVQHPWKTGIRSLDEIKILVGSQIGNGAVVRFLKDLKANSR